MEKRFDLCLVVGDGKERGATMDRIDNIQEYDLSRQVDRADLISAIEQLIDFAKAQDN